MSEVQKPDFVDDRTLEEYLDYLDFLRETGVTNMFGAAPYLMAEYPDLNQYQARAIVSYWMATFSERHNEVGDR